MDENIAQAKELARADGAIVSGNKITRRFLFKKARISFTPQQEIFIHALQEPFANIDFDDEDHLQANIEQAIALAAEKSRLTFDEALYFFKKPKVQNWLTELSERNASKFDWSVTARWWKEADAIYSGRKNCSKIQLEVWKAIGERVAPIKREREVQAAPKIEINIDPTAVQEAFRRQQAIEAEIVNEKSA